MISVDVQIDPPYQSWLSAPALAELVRHTLHRVGRTTGEVSVVITSDEAVQALNEQYRGVSAPTDVLSFPAEDEDGSDFVLPMPALTPYLGDIIIAGPTATRQAQANGHQPAEEVALLVIHGTLHLLGFDHLTEVEKAEMWAVQEEILRQHNLSHVTPTQEPH
jgi:probable rRNA maturation factor